MRLAGGGVRVKLVVRVTVVTRMAGGPEHVVVVVGDKARCYTCYCTQTSNVFLTLFITREIVILSYSVILID